MLRIALVDDHQIVRAGFRELLADELGLEIAFEAASGEAALESLREQPVDVLPGDRLSVACTFDNTEEWREENDLPAPTDVDWGEGTLDEMCVAHTRITHR